MHYIMDILFGKNNLNTTDLNIMLLYTSLPYERLMLSWPADLLQSVSLNKKNKLSINLSIF